MANQKRVRILWLALLTLVLMGGGGLVGIYFFREPSLVEFLLGEDSYVYQLSFGIVYGYVAGAFAWWVIQRDFMRPVREKYSGLFRQFSLGPRDILFISFCAGVGEELLFRGGMQPLLGVWWTSIIFVALHGYLNPRDWRVSVYGLAMCAIIVGIGYMAEGIGILSSMAAHTVIDIFLLFKLLSAPVQPVVVLEEE